MEATTPPLLRDIAACVFDAYGTLLDYRSAAARCKHLLGDKLEPLNALWRDKQLQYTWLRSLQGRYADFHTVTAEALDFALDTLGIADASIHRQLMALYETLDAFEEVPAVLRRLRQAGIKTAILSNGTPAMLESAAASAGIRDLLDRVLSVDALRVYKPDPRVYQLAVDELGIPADHIAFQSANAWDAHGAATFGMRVVWCNRYGQRAERLPGQLAAEVASLRELPGLLGL